MPGSELQAAPAPLSRPAPAAAARSGPARAMERLGLVRDIDFALHLPLRYEDETRLVPIAQARVGEQVQVEGVVAECRIEGRSRKQLLVTLCDADDTAALAGKPAHLRGQITLRFLNFYASQTKTMAAGVRLRVRGELRAGLFGPEMVHPLVKAVQPGEPLAQSLTPIYPTTAGLPQAYLRKAVASGLARAGLQEILPPQLLPAGPQTLPSLKEALRYLHHPPPDADLHSLQEREHPAWERLKFEELLAQQLSQLQARAQRARQRAPALRARPGGVFEQLLAALPFELTRAQRRVVDEIAVDLAGAQDEAAPMHRLLQGDVGAGKTVVAALAAAIAIDAGWQCALMAPTEILAEQHFRKLITWLEPLLAPAGRGVAWLTGSRKGKARAAMVERIASGEAALVVGTHAVIQDDVHFAKLGLAIVDEQHRFGVQQRLALRRKLAGVDAPPAGAAELEPHLLMMSATPIPRTLAMTCFADLDISTIDELPPGRTPIVTKVFQENRRGDVVARIADEVARGRQVYWVCPLIEEAEDDAAAADAPPAMPAWSRGKPLSELRNVIETHAMLSEALPGRSVGLVHGRLKAAEKAEVMARFTAGQLDVLVATTVIEVGVDVPNASLMVIEHAERFGLSQLHQLRGRVGRGAVASVCVLIYSPPLSDSGKQRLKAMAETTDGFEIARRDLAIRGPGEFFGERQSGVALLRFADLQLDEAIVGQARRAAEQLLQIDPQAAARHVARWLGGKTELWMA